MSHSLAHQERRRARAKRKAAKQRKLWLVGRWEPERDRDEFGDFVEKMTNHQRCLWMQAGRPGQRDRDVERLADFVAGTWWC